MCNALLCAEVAEAETNSKRHAQGHVEWRRQNHTFREKVDGVGGNGSALQDGKLESGRTYKRDG